MIPPIPSTKIATIIVTHNRRLALADCLKSVLAQTYPVTTIIIVDNASSDGTPEYLKASGILAYPQMQYLRLPKNSGGAGGFSAGIKNAMTAHYDWLWLMDDDIQCTPTALEELLKYTSSPGHSEIGFLCSKVLWKEDQVHRMNIPQFTQTFSKQPLTRAQEGHQPPQVRSASFASLLLNTAAVRSVGLPIKEFFIWRDDVEYTERITDQGWHGIYAEKSLVYHNTTENYRADIHADIFSANPCYAQRYYYGIRNLLFCTRKAKGIIFLFGAVIYHLSVFNLLILLRRKCYRMKFIKTNTRAALKALFWYPAIEGIASPDNQK